MLALPKQSLLHPVLVGLLVSLVVRAQTTTAASTAADQPQPSPTGVPGAADKFLPDSTPWNGTDPCQWIGYREFGGTAPVEDLATHGSTFCVPTGPANETSHPPILQVEISSTLQHMGLCDPGRFADILFETLEANPVARNCDPDHHDTSNCEATYKYNCFYVDKEHGKAYGTDNVQDCQMHISSDFSGSSDYHLIQKLRAMIINLYSSVSVNPLTGGPGVGARNDTFEGPVIAGGGRNGPPLKWHNNFTVFDAPASIEVTAIGYGLEHAVKGPRLTVAISCDSPVENDFNACEFFTGLVSSVAGFLSPLLGLAKESASVAADLTGSGADFLGSFCPK